MGHKKTIRELMTFHIVPFDCWHDGVKNATGFSIGQFLVNESLFIIFAFQICYKATPACARYIRLDLLGTQFTIYEKNTPLA